MIQFCSNIPWSIVSKAFNRSMNTHIKHMSLSIALDISSTKSSTAIYVEWLVRKPYCFRYRTSFLLKKYHMHDYKQYVPGFLTNKVRLRQVCNFQILRGWPFYIYRHNFCNFKIIMYNSRWKWCIKNHWWRGSYLFSNLFYQILCHHDQHFFCSVIYLLFLKLHLHLLA